MCHFIYIYVGFMLMSRFPLNKYTSIFSKFQHYKKISHLQMLIRDLPPRPFQTMFNLGLDEFTSQFVFNSWIGNS